MDQQLKETFREFLQKLDLERPVVFFDLESTGTDPVNDQIMEVYFLKMSPEGEGSINEYQKYICPDFEPAQGALDKHGITLDSVKDQPKFRDIAGDIQEFIKDCDLGGYNIENFDLPLLTEEMLRNGFNFNPLRFKLVDIFKILIKMEPRDLGSIYKRFVGKELEDAHQAGADVWATIEIFNEQITHYGLEPNVNSIHSLIQEDKKKVDSDGKFVKKENDIYFDFGKFKGMSVRQAYDENPTYFDWMQKADFATHTKLIANKLKSLIETEKEKYK